ncbi:hypothetical protein WDW37_16820 [Bdellovibrionota bacterium FG-1]
MLFRKVLKFSPFIVLTVLNLLVLSMNAHAAKEGGTSGGGGNTGEIPVDEIRADILKWVSEGGAQGLKLPARTSYDEYRSSMTRFLLPHSVVLTAVTSEQEKEEERKPNPDPELIVKVEGQPKTCRGFVSIRDNRPHMLCNSDRFKATSPSEQYRLVHHEYAGLAGVEQNMGASSDYEISNQITDYLVPETVLRLSVKKHTSKVVSEDTCGYVEYFSYGTPTASNQYHVVISDDSQDDPRWQDCGFDLDKAVEDKLIGLVTFAEKNRLKVCVKKSPIGPMSVSSLYLKAI